MACRDSRQVQRLGCCTRRTIGQNVATIVVSPAGTVLLKNIPGRLSDYSERENVLLEEECGFIPQPATVDMMFVVRRLQELTRKKDTPLCLCFTDLTKAYNSVDRNLLWDVLDRFCMPPRYARRHPMISRWHASMRAFG